MAKEVLMPKLSSTMETGYVTQWIKHEGDKVRVGDPIFEVMTDKIAIEVESYDEGVILKILVAENEVVPVNSVIAYIGKPGETIEASAAPSVAKEEPKEEAKTEVKDEVVSAPVSTPKPASKPVNVRDVRATPAARRLVREKGLDLAHVFSSMQPSPRLVVADVMSYLEKPQGESQPVSTPSTLPSTPQSVSESTFTPWKGIRKLVKEQMSKSASTIPHVTIHGKVDARALLTLKDELTSPEQKITLTHLIAYFTARTLLKHPLLNARTSEEGITFFKDVNLGIATALTEGLIVPVVHGAHSLKLTDLAHSISTVASKARKNELSLDQLKGGTFTITSLGASKVVHFNPIINLPEVAILGVSTIVDELRLENGQVVNVPVFNFSLSFDHRAIDGSPAAAFLTDLISVCEKPSHVILMQ
jgi:pyruvate dehydrogenase E2 component (dihydrolipoamide acetyltransferase)